MGLMKFSMLRTCAYKKKIDVIFLFMNFFYFAEIEIPQRVISCAWDDLIASTPVSVQKE